MEEHSNKDAPLTHTNFLCLPPEIRNTIYDFASRDERTVRNSQDANTVPGINVREKTSIQDGGPALLRTYRQIRQEALGFFYSNKNFHIHPEDWTGDLCSRFWSFINKHDFKEVDVQVTPSYEKKSWHELMGWLEKYHAGQTYPASLQGFTYPISGLTHSPPAPFKIGFDILPPYSVDSRTSPLQDGVVVHAFNVAADFRHEYWAVVGPCIAINLRSWVDCYPGWKFNQQETCEKI